VSREPDPDGGNRRRNIRDQRTEPPQVVGQGTGAVPNSATPGTSEARQARAGAWL